MRSSGAGEVDILGRPFRSSHVMFWLLAGPFALWLLWGLFGVRAIAGLVGLIGKWDAMQVPGEMAALGQTGDVFGGINALFAAYAFVGVAVAAFFQHKTFRLIEEQQELQSFEPLFFKLVELNRTHVPSVSESGESLGSLVKAMVGTLQGAGIATMIAGDQKDKAKSLVISTYEGLYARNENVFGPYFRSLYHVFKLINRSRLPKASKIEYANIMRAMLAEQELYLIAVNCLHPKNHEFKQLAEKYGLLKHIDLDGNDSPARVFARLVPAFYSKTARQGAEQREEHWALNPAERPPDM